MPGKHTSINSEGGYFCYHGAMSTSFPLVVGLKNLAGQHWYGGAAMLDECAEIAHPEWPRLPSGAVRTAFILDGECWVFTETPPHLPAGQVKKKKVYDTLFCVRGDPEPWWPILPEGPLEVTCMCAIESSQEQMESIQNKSKAPSVHFNITSCHGGGLFFMVALAGYRSHALVEVEIHHGKMGLHRDKVTALNRQKRAPAVIIHEPLTRHRIRP